MTTRDRLRVLVGVVVALAVVGPLAWMWWHSRLPSTYSVMDMGYADYGGGARPAHGANGGHGDPGTDMAGMPSASGRLSVRDLDTPESRPADVRVDLVARQGQVELASGRKVSGYTLNGTSPGPLIEAGVGQLVEVRLRNESVEGGVALHWHGVDVPNAQDGVAGVTQDAVGVGEEHTYRWVAPHAGTFWYHSHQISNEQVVGGLFAGLVIHPEVRDRGVREVLGLAHLYDGKQTLNGETGDVAVLARPGERVRVRLVNTDNGPQTAWSSEPYRLLAYDGYDVNGPERVSGRGTGIPAGGRVDLEVVVPTDGSAVGVQLLGGTRLVIGPEGSTAAAVERPEKDLDLLGYGASAPTGLDASDPDRSFEYSLGRRPGFLDGRPGLWWSVNGHLYPDMPMMTVREGEVVRMRISNHSGEVHPMHLHGHHAVVVSRNGKQATGSPWWFDSLAVQDGEEFVVAFRADNPGIWMDHCHDLEHATQGLVTHLMYDGVTTPYELGKDSGNTPE